MTNSVRIHTEVDGKAGQDLKGLKGQFQDFQNSSVKGLLGVGAVAGVAAGGVGLIADAAASAGGAVIGFVEDSIRAASDLNETMTKSEVIFGDNAKAVEDWASKLAESAGLSERAALDASSGFAGLFKTVGLGIDEATSKSEGLTQLGADLASFFNTDVGTALDALKSGLNGEAEPLRQFNIFLSETAVSAKLAEMGVKKVGGTFTEAQKATARYALIMEQTGDAQGDFARTGDGLANSQRTIAAEVENLQATIGQELLPVVRDLSNWAAHEGVPALKELFQTVKDNSDGIKMFADALGFLSNPLGAAGNAGLKFGESLTKAGQSAEGATRDTDKLGGAMGDAAQEAQAAGKAAAGSAKNIAKVTNVVQDAAKAYDDWKGAIHDAAQTLNEEKRGHQETSLEIKANKLDQKDLIDKLHELEAIKHPTRDQRQDLIDTKLAILQGKDALNLLKADLVTTGKISMSVTETWIQRLGSQADASDAKVVALIADLRRLGGTSGGGGGGGGGGGSAPSHPVNNNGSGRASGGPVFPGQTYQVGEDEQETLRMGANGVGYVTPNGRGRRGGGGDVHVHIHGVSVLTPGSAQAVADAVAPHVTRWQQQRGL